MYFTLETDYALRIVEFLARTPGRTGAQRISEENAVTLRFSLKILRKLVGRGIIRSYKGAQGGYEIALPLEDISLASIIETIEGPYRISRCLDENHDCYRAEGCSYREVFSSISHDVRSRLSNISIKDIISNTEDN